MEILNTLKEIIKEYTIARDDTFESIDFNKDPSVGIHYTFRLHGDDRWTVVFDDPILGNVFVDASADIALRKMYDYLVEYVNQFKQDYTRMYIVDDEGAVFELSKDIVYGSVEYGLDFTTFLSREQAEAYAANLVKE